VLDQEFILGFQCWRMYTIFSRDSERVFSAGK